MSENESFLDSFSSISENQAEYTILTELYRECGNKIFIFELCELCKVKFEYGKILNFINQNYKSHDLRKFKLEMDSSISCEVLDRQSCGVLSWTLWAGSRHLCRAFLILQ